MMQLKSAYKLLGVRLDSIIHPYGNKIDYLSNQIEIQRSDFSSSSSVIDGYSNDGDIPDWLLFELLLRLPHHVLYSYIIVSKKWLSMVSDRNFIRTYISRSLLLPRPWTVLISQFHRESLDSDPSGYIVPRHLYLQPHVCKLRLPCDQQPVEGLVLGVSDGLVLYSGITEIRPRIGHVHFYICNPISGQLIAFGAAKFMYPRLGWGFLTRVNDEGVLKSFRVIHALMSGENHTLVTFSTYYSEIGKWKEFKVPYPCGSSHGLNKLASAAALNGILHWVVEQSGVVAYDPDGNPEQMRVIEIPLDAWYCSGLRKWRRSGTSLCAAYEGKLRFFSGIFENGDGFQSFSVWTLEDYTSGKWCLQHKIRSFVIPDDINLFGDGSSFGVNDYRKCVRADPMFFDPFDKDLVYLKFLFWTPSLGNAERVVSYNLKTEMLGGRHKMLVRDGPFSLQIIGKKFSFLFVVPPWPTIIADHHLERSGVEEEKQQ